MGRNTGINIHSHFIGKPKIESFRLTRQDGGAPIVLKVQGGKNVFFTVDVVPSFKFELIRLKGLKGRSNELYMRLTNEIIQKHNIQDVKVGQYIHYFFIQMFHP